MWGKVIRKTEGSVSGSILFHHAKGQSQSYSEKCFKILEMALSEMALR